MPSLKVLLDAKGKVVGTAQDHVDATGSGPQAGVIAGKGQRLIDINVPISVARLDATALHKTITSKHLPKK